jgi:nitrogen fixation protein NifU and related proteins
VSDEKFYKEELMEHFKYPRNKKNIDKPDFSSGQENNACGDKVLIQGKISKDGRISELAFDGAGCVISQATASMLTEKCKGKTVDEVLKMGSQDILQMLGVQLGPVRLRCALLSLQVLQDALSKLNLKNN